MTMDNDNFASSRTSGKSSNIISVSTRTTPQCHQESAMAYDHHVYHTRRPDDVSTIELSDMTMQDVTISHTLLTSQLLRSSTTIGQQCRVRFSDTIAVHEVPSRKSFSVEMKRRIWWSKTEEASIEEEVRNIANLLDLNRLPKSTSSYGYVRGPVACTRKATLNRVLQRDQQYHAVFAVQEMHREVNSVDSMDRAAKQSLKRMLIAKLCSSISQSSTQHALEIARLDAEQAELVYQEAFGDMEHAPFDDLYVTTVRREKPETDEKSASKAGPINSTPTTIFL
jgi:hypothetical protein